MKKMSMALMAFTALFVLAVMTGAVSATTPLTAVSGQVTDGGSNPVENATVTVTCMHNGTNTTKTVYTEASGKYYAFFPTSECDAGDSVAIHTMKGDMHGMSEGTVAFDKSCKINTSLIDVQIPEFGVIGAVLVVLAGIGIIAYRRR